MGACAIVLNEDRDEEEYYHHYLGYGKLKIVALICKASAADVQDILLAVLPLLCYSRWDGVLSCS